MYFISVQVSWCPGKPWRACFWQKVVENCHPGQLYLPLGNFENTWLLKSICFIPLLFSSKTTLLCQKSCWSNDNQPYIYITLFASLLFNYVVKVAPKFPTDKHHLVFYHLVGFTHVGSYFPGVAVRGVFIPVYLCGGFYPATVVVVHKYSNRGMCQDAFSLVTAPADTICSLADKVIWHTRRIRKHGFKVKDKNAFLFGNMVD